MNTVKIYRKNENAILPSNPDGKSAGWDLYSAEDFILAGTVEGERIPDNTKYKGTPINRYHVFDTGIIAIPPTGFRIDIRSRSGLSIKSKIILLNSIGTIDSNYVGENDTLKIGLMNIGYYNVEITKGMRIAQMLIIFDWTFNVEEVNKKSIKNISRGGLGSTGD